MKAKIAIAVDEFAPTDVRVMNQARLLAKSGFKVYLLSQTYSRRPVLQENENITIEFFYMPRIFKTLAKLLMNTVPIYEILWGRRFEAFVKKHDAEIVHVHDLYMSKIGRRGAGSRPMILDLHENYPVAIMSYDVGKVGWKRFLARPQLWKRKEKRYLEYADELIVLSHKFKSELIEKYDTGAHTIHVLGNYPNLEVIQPYQGGYIERQESQSELVVFYFGRVAQRRGIFTLLDAVHLCIQKGVAVRCLVIGPLDRLDQDRFDAYLEGPLSDHLTYIPWIEPSELMSYASRIDVCVAPFVKNDQHESGVANKIFQYMLMAKPLLVSNCIPQMEVVQKYECGMVFESENVEDLEDKLLKMIDSKHKFEKMGLNGRDAVLKDLNFQSQSQVLLKLYRAIESRVLKPKIDNK